MKIDDAFMSLPLPRKTETSTGLNEHRSTSPWQREMEKAQDQMWFQRSARQGKQDERTHAAESDAAPSPFPGSAPSTAQHRATAQQAQQAHQAAATSTSAQPKGSASATAVGQDVVGTTSTAASSNQDAVDASGDSATVPGVLASIASTTTQVLPTPDFGNDTNVSAPTPGRVVSAGPAALSNAGAQMSNASGEEIDESSFEHETPEASPDKSGRSIALAGSAASTAQTQESLRIYAEWNGQDAHVWVGKDGSAGISDSELAQWVHESLGIAQYRLASLVCNGVQLVSDGAQPKRKPTASTHSSALARPTAIHNPSTEAPAETTWQTSAR